MKNIILAFIFLISANAFAQKTENPIDNIAGGGYSKIEVKDSLKITLTTGSKEILYRSGKYLQKSAYYEYGAIGSLAASTACFFIGFNNFDIFNEDNPHSINAISLIAGTLLFTSAVVCTIASIRYDKKAGKELKLFVRGGTGSVVVTF